MPIQPNVQAPLVPPGFNPINSPLQNQQVPTVMQATPLQAMMQATPMQEMMQSPPIQAVMQATPMQAMPFPNPQPYYSMPVNPYSFNSMMTIDNFLQPSGFFAGRGNPRPFNGQFNAARPFNNNFGGMNNNAGFNGGFNLNFGGMNNNAGFNGGFNPNFGGMNNNAGFNGGFNSGFNGGFNSGFNIGANNSLTCQFCDKVGHGARTCRTLANMQKGGGNNQNFGNNGGFGNNQNFEGCIYCGMKNHKVEKCRFLFGFPDQQQNGNTVAHDGTAMLAATTSAPQFWLADTGATNHMTCNPMMLNNVTPYNASDSVQIGNGAQLPITHTGNTMLVWFDEFMCVIQDKVLGIIPYKGLSKQGLYPIPFDLPLLNKSAEKSTTAVASSPSTQAAGFVGKLVKYSLWHQMFGHPSNDIVRAMLKKCNIHSVGDSEQFIYVWGPAPYLSIDGFKYFVLFIDDCTRFTWTFPMKNKYEVFPYFKSLCALISTQFSAKVKCFRSDGGGEFMGLQFKGFMQENGIVHQVSCPYTSEQNGVSERKNRHIRETVVTFYSKLPIDQICRNGTSMIPKLRRKGRSDCSN
ncbi:hypothetical protein ACLB2K_023822 [Fragaria x ananassa]